MVPFLLFRRLSLSNPSLHRFKAPSCLSHHFAKSLSSLQPSNPTSPDAKPTSLSARMSFVFDQIDAMEKERSQKDETLQRIRAWRESKRSPQTQNPNSVPANSAVGLAPETESRKESKIGEDSGDGSLLNKEVELVHPWPEWIELMERLVQQNYFDHKRKDEDKMIEDLGFSVSDVVEDQGFDFTRDWQTAQTAVLNFGRDRFDILRPLSRQDLQILVGYGCPSADKKVVFSSKLLRKHVHLDEGDVCSSCSLRSSCERAYLLTNKEDEARTIDVMRVLLTYGFDPVNGSVANKPLLKIKAVRTVVRKLLHEVVKLSSVPIDPNLSPPVIKKPPPKVKTPPPPPKKRAGRDDIEMKKGDWLCPKCDFMNFAKNTICRQCDAKRPKRQLLPGEWECPQCNFLNYRRNVVCFHCEHKRPPEEFTGSHLQEKRNVPARSGRVAREDVSNAWNFDFDDDESDGADVAAFEYADSQKLDEDFSLNKAQVESSRGYEDGLQRSSRPPRMYERGDPRNAKPGTGFNDFDDEEDDVDSYELDTRNEMQKSRVDFSELEGDSESEDLGQRDDRRQQLNSPSRGRLPKPTRRKGSTSDAEDFDMDFGSDDDLPIHPNWKSSHVANSRQKTRDRGTMSYGSDDDTGLSSSGDEASDNFGSRRPKGTKWGSKRNFGRKGSSGSESEPFPDIETDDENVSFRKRETRGKRAGLSSYGNSSSRNQQRNSFTRDSSRMSRDSRGSETRMRGSDNGGFRRDSNRSFRDSRGGERRTRDDDYGGFRSPRKESYGRQRFNSSGSRPDSYLDDDRYKRPQVNVR